MVDEKRHVWGEGHQVTKCGKPVVGGMKMTDDPDQSDCTKCSK